MSRRQVAKKRRDAAPQTAVRLNQLYKFGGIAILLLAMFGVYWPSMNGTMLWDDSGHLTRPELQSVTGLYRIWFDMTATQQYYPLLHSAFWIEHKLWGETFWAYHLINVIWHGIAVVLVYLILKKLTVPGALLAAAFFALHPVMVESVAWMSEQKNTLSAVFYLSAMLAYLTFDESRRGGHYLLALVLFVLGLLTKTVTATLPAALLVIFWWQRGTLSWRRDVVPLVPMFVLGAIAGLVTAWVERRLIGAEGTEFDLTFLERGLLAGRVIWFYIGKLLWPTNLMFIYPRWDVDPAVWWQWLFPLATLAVTVMFWAVRKRWRAPLAGWLFFCGTLFPVLGFLNVYPFKFSFVADHFQYLASLGIFSLFASGIALAVARLPRAERAMGAVLPLLLLGTLAMLSAQQSRIYTDSIALYEATLAKNANCWLAHNNLGWDLFLRGDQDRGMDHCRTAVLLKPDCVEARNNFGLLLSTAGRHAEAFHELEVALTLRPDDPMSLSNMGIAMINANRFPEAIDYITRALRFRSDDAEAHNNLGVALHRVGQIPQAIEQFRKAVQLNPNFANAYVNLGNLLTQTGQADEAIAAYERAVELQPNSTAAHNRLGEALQKFGR